MSGVYSNCMSSAYDERWGMTSYSDLSWAIRGVFLGGMGGSLEYFSL